MTMAPKPFGTRSRKRVVQSRFSENEYARLLRLAAADHRTLASAVKAAVLTALERAERAAGDERARRPA